MNRAVVVALLLAALLVLPAVTANGDDAWDDEGRRLEVDEGSDGFELRSDRAVGDAHDRITFRLDGGNVEFRFGIRESADAVETEAELRVRLERVFEFADENGDGSFGAGDDVRSELDPSDLDLVAIAAETVESGGVTGVQITATYNLTSGGSLGFRATAFGNLTTFQGLQQSPVDLKLDLLLTDYPFDSSESLPAIELRVSAEAPGGPNLTADRVSFTTGNLTATFAWKGTASVDGVDRAVGTTVVRLPDETENGTVEAVESVTFAYAHGDAIVHDPTFAFGLATLPPAILGVLGNWGFYALGAVLAAVVFASLALARRGRKAKGQ